jgi:hypothetical protein
MYKAIGYVQFYAEYCEYLEDIDQFFSPFEVDYEDDLWLAIKIAGHLIDSNATHGFEIGYHHRIKFEVHFAMRSMPCAVDGLHRNYAQLKTNIESHYNDFKDVAPPDEDVWDYLERL